MSARRHEPPSYESRSIQAPGMMRHGSHPDHGDTKPVAQLGDKERLLSDNQKLATSHVALRQDLAATKQEIQKLRDHIGSIQTESDIQVRLLLDKIAKMEVQVHAGENVKKELQRAHTEARGLVATRNELLAQIEKSGQELEMVRADVEKLPELQAELDGLRLEHHKLRLIFENEKSLNMDKVAELELIDRELVGMAREVERLRGEVAEAEKRANAPAVPAVYSGPYVNQELYPPPPTHASGAGYVDGYGNYHPVHVEGVIPYGGGGGPRATTPGGNAQWGSLPGVPYGLSNAEVGAHHQWRGAPPYNNSRT